MFARLIAAATLGAGITGFACLGGQTPTDWGQCEELGNAPNPYGGCVKGYSPIFPGACHGGIFPFVPP